MSRRPQKKAMNMVDGKINLLQNQKDLEHRESNPGRQSDSLECYPYTMPDYISLFWDNNSISLLLEIWRSVFCCGSTNENETTHEAYSVSCATSTRRRKKHVKQNDCRKNFWSSSSNSTTNNSNSDNNDQ